jgi:hypothetical protein
VAVDVGHPPSARDIHSLSGAERERHLAIAQPGDEDHRMSARIWIGLEGAESLKDGG